jgi:hypothetical protein
MNSHDLRSENDRLRDEVEELRLRLEEAEQAIEAIRTGQVESLIVDGPNGPRIFSIEDADHSYRLLVEVMNEGAATLRRLILLTLPTFVWHTLARRPQVWPKGPDLCILSWKANCCLVT